jgi:hypothetical protein
MKMKKMSTLFVVNYENNRKGTITEEVRPENAWVFDYPNNVKITRKFDGSAAAVINGVLFKRYDAKNGKPIPADAIVCGEPDLITGHNPCWIPVTLDLKCDQYFREAWFNIPEADKLDGTYELCGEKVGVNAEGVEGHTLIRHGSETFDIEGSLSFDKIKTLLETMNVEGFVFHHVDGRMCKIRKSDFGFKRGEVK